jgi:3-oxoacyl-[acyl-carrier protein] reductase
MGLGVGEYFAQQGIGVVLVDKSVAPGQALAAKYPGLVQLIEIDLANHALVNERLGPLLAADDAPEVLINGAGWSPKYDTEGKPWKPWTMPLEHWQLVMGINVDATFNMCRLALPAMVKRKYGRIVNIASLAARTGGGVAPVHYVTSKAALLGMTKAIAKDVGQYNITVNAINPGRIDTPMIHDVPDEVNQGYAARIPLGRLGTPQDIAGTIAYLCSDLGDYLTGTTIEVNGGLYMGP